MMVVVIVAAVMVIVMVVAVMVVVVVVERVHAAVTFRVSSATIRHEANGCTTIIGHSQCLQACAEGGGDGDGDGDCALRCVCCRHERTCWVTCDTHRHQRRSCPPCRLVAMVLVKA
jgi:hypothetical protein